MWYYRFGTPTTVGMLNMANKEKEKIEHIGNSEGVLDK